MGTPAYMAPEQARDTRQASAASDVFSLGATLLFAATGHAPYQGETVMDVLVRLATEPPDLSGLPAELADLITACLERARRPRPTAGALLARLGALRRRPGRAAHGRTPHLPGPAMRADRAEYRSTAPVPRTSPPGRRLPRTPPHAPRGARRHRGGLRRLRRLRGPSSGGTGDRRTRADPAPEALPASAREGRAARLAGISAVGGRPRPPPLLVARRSSCSAAVAASRTGAGRARGIEVYARRPGRPAAPPPGGGRSRSAPAGPCRSRDELEPFGDGHRLPSTAAGCAPGTSVTISLAERPGRRRGTAVVEATGGTFNYVINQDATSSTAGEIPRLYARRSTVSQVTVVAPMAGRPAPSSSTTRPPRRPRPATWPG